MGYKLKDLYAKIVAEMGNAQVARVDLAAMFWEHADITREQTVNNHINMMVTQKLIELTPEGDYIVRK